MTYMLRNLPLRELIALRWRLDLEMLRRFWWVYCLVLVFLAFAIWWRRKPPRRSAG